MNARLPLVLIVGMPASVHAARWVNTFRRRNVRVVLFPSIAQDCCPEFEPVRSVRSRADLEALAPGEIGLFPLEGLPTRAGQASKLFGVSPLKVRLDLLPAPEALATAIAALQPDLIHNLELQYGGYLVLECRALLAGRFPPWVASSWGSDLYLYRQLPDHEPVLRRLLREIDALQSDCARDLAWAEEAGFRGLRFPQMPATGGVDFSVLPDPARLPPPSQRKDVLIKGYHGASGRGLQILQALHRVAPQVRGLRFFVTRGPSQLAPFVQRLRELDGLDIMQAPYLPQHSDAMQRLAGCRFAVGYGISDGISSTLLEAMTVGTFMIQASTCCGDEWIRHPETGLIVPPHDVAALGRAIVRAATDDVLVDGAVVENRRTVEARWDADINGALIARTYHQLTGARADG